MECPAVQPHGPLLGGRPEPVERAAHTPVRPRVLVRGGIRRPQSTRTVGQPTPLGAVRRLVADPVSRPVSPDPGPRRPRESTARHPVRSTTRLARRSVVPRRTWSPNPDRPPRRTGRRAPSAPPCGNQKRRRFRATRCKHHLSAGGAQRGRPRRRAAQRNRVAEPSFWSSGPLRAPHSVCADTQHATGSTSDGSLPQSSTTISAQRRCHERARTARRLAEHVVEQQHWRVLVAVHDRALAVATRRERRCSPCDACVRIGPSIVSFHCRVRADERDPAVDLRPAPGHNRRAGRPPISAVSAGSSGSGATSSRHDGLPVARQAAGGIHGPSRPPAAAGPHQLGGRRELLVSTSSRRGLGTRTPTAAALRCQDPTRSARRAVPHQAPSSHEVQTARRDPLSRVLGRRSEHRTRRRPCWARAGIARCNGFGCAHLRTSA